MCMSLYDVDVSTALPGLLLAGQPGPVIPAQTASDADTTNRSEHFKLGLAQYLYAAASARHKGSGDLAWVKVALDEAFVKEVLDLQTRVVTRGLVHCAVSWTAQSWDGTKPIEGTLASLHVNERSCWFRTLPKDRDRALETVRMDIGALIDAISTRRGTTPALWYQGALIYAGASGFGLLKRLIECGELKAQGE
jgi:hypothetical protein